MMKNTITESWQDRLNDALKEEGIVEKSFFNFLMGKVKRLPLAVEDFGWGVFPITNDEGVLVDVRMVVPIIYDTKSLCVNIHEYTHAYEAYLSLGSVYVWNVEAS